MKNIFVKMCCFLVKYETFHKYLDIVLLKYNAFRGKSEVCKSIISFLLGRVAATGKT